MKMNYNFCTLDTYTEAEIPYKIMRSEPITELQAKIIHEHPTWNTIKEVLGEENTQKIYAAKFVISLIDYELEGIIVPENTASNPATFIKVRNICK